MDTLVLIIYLLINQSISCLFSEVQNVSLFYLTCYYPAKNDGNTYVSFQIMGGGQAEDGYIFIYIYASKMILYVCNVTIGSELNFNYCNSYPDTCI